MTGHEKQHKIQFLSAVAALRQRKIGKMEALNAMAASLTGRFDEAKMLIDKSKKRIQTVQTLLDISQNVQPKICIPDSTRYPRMSSR